MPYIRATYSIILSSDASPPNNSSDCTGALCAGIENLLHITTTSAVLKSAVITAADITADTSFAQHVCLRPRFVALRMLANPPEDERLYCGCREKVQGSDKAV
ncbi:MAG: hypothetical protein SO125_06725 [Eubacteriales bacterium]|nr:hypothetical protein [Eubacteriales bacterium]